MIKYYLYKILNKVLSRVVYIRNGKKIERGIFEIIPKNFEFQSKIVLSFWDKNLMHLGDQLFHVPIIKNFINRYEFYVCGESPLNPYFEYLSAKICGYKNFKIKGAIFIGKDDMAYSFWKKFGKENFYIGINYAVLQYEEKITVSLLSILLNALKRFDENIDVDKELNRADFSFPIFENKNLDEEERKILENISKEDKKFLVFNNYVASDYISARKRINLLEKIAKEKKEEGYSIIHIGSKKDKINDKKNYNFVDYDLRGKLNPLTLFNLFNLNNVYGIISFDTFPMHVASIFKKDLYVVVRKEERKEIYRKKFIPCYPNGSDIVKLYL
jgi:ADP-heptose:LPS heptosyltransferase